MRVRRYLPLAITLAAVLSLAAVATASAGGRPLSTDLSWTEEVNAAGEPNQGEVGVTGHASLTLNPGQGVVCYDIAVTAITPIVAGHIHRAPAGSNGPIVVPFVTQPDGTFAGCATGVDRALILDIIRDPEDFYVNVHSEAVMPGATRGQLGD